MTDERLNKIYDKTDGCCHICHKRLSFQNYGIRNTKGCWQVEHSVPKAKGGTDHLKNLYPACISCNQEKAISTTRTARRRNGVTRAPYSKSKKEKIRNENIGGFATAGAIIGWNLGGPVGALFGGLIGSGFGRGISPK